MVTHTTYEWKVYFCYFIIGLLVYFLFVYSLVGLIFSFFYLSLSGCCWFLLLCAAGLLQRIYTYIFCALRSGCFLSPHIHFLYIITRRNLSECWINFEGADKWLGPRRAWHSSNMFLWSEIAIANVYFVTYNISIKNPFINLPDRGFLSVAHTHI